MNIQPQPSNSLSYFPLPVIELGTKKKCCKKYKKKGRHCKKCPRVEMMRKHNNLVNTLSVDNPCA